MLCLVHTKNSTNIGSLPMLFTATFGSAAQLSFTQAVFIFSSFSLPVSQQNIILFFQLLWYLWVLLHVCHILNAIYDDLLLILN